MEIEENWWMKEKEKRTMNNIENELKRKEISNNNNFLT
jgi:hypothetical protein